MPTTDRKRGRINLNADERRDISIQFRVNKEEFEYLKSLVEASGLERGHYIRREILKAEPVVKRKMPEVNQKTYIQLSAIGNNINWICPYISRHLLSLTPLQARCRRYSRGER
ncbi:plasmid mobilization protein [Escherichia coli]|uniref:plasmid mobilization protein n=1 Tax=Escherichia coli TaxID=562 RepID=UPI00301E140A